MTWAETPAHIFGRPAAAPRRAARTDLARGGRVRRRLRNGGVRQPGLLLDQATPIEDTADRMERAYATRRSSARVLTIRRAGGRGRRRHRRRRVDRRAGLQPGTPPSGFPAQPSATSTGPARSPTAFARPTRLAYAGGAGAVPARAGTRCFSGGLEPGSRLPVGASYGWFRGTSCRCLASLLNLDALPPGPPNPATSSAPALLEAPRGAARPPDVPPEERRRTLSPTAAFSDDLNDLRNGRRRREFRPAISRRSTPPPTGWNPTR